MYTVCRNPVQSTSLRCLSLIRWTATLIGRKGSNRQNPPPESCPDLFHCVVASLEAFSLAAFTALSTIAPPALSSLALESPPGSLPVRKEAASASSRRRPRVALTLRRRRDAAELLHDHVGLEAMLMLRRAGGWRWVCMVAGSWGGIGVYSEGVRGKKKGRNGGGTTVS